MGAKSVYVYAGDPSLDTLSTNNLPIADHTDYTLRDLLISLRPDILHAHHPNVIPAAWHAMDELRRGGHPVRISYDVRENFSGLPEKEIGDVTGHRTMVEMHLGSCPSPTTSPRSMSRSPT